MGERNDAFYHLLAACCQPEEGLQSRQNISIKERGVCYRAHLNPARAAAVFAVDGGLITEGCRCDKLVLSRNPQQEQTWIGHFIELKGSDVHHAIEQLETSLRNDLFVHPSLTKRYARIVANKFPSSNADPAMERAKIKFIKEYKCELKCITSHTPETI